MVMKVCLQVYCIQATPWIKDIRDEHHPTGNYVGEFGHKLLKLLAE